MIEINGSTGEGGGQILRTALSLSCYLKKTVRIFNIRANRKKPGLQPQHITCIKAAQLISEAEIKGNSLGSQELIFVPNIVQSGHYHFDIGTAGSVSLVFQTILLPLCFAHGKSDITITGGTHVPWSPPFHYLKDVFLATLNKLGVDVHLDIDRWGFYPKGGGRIKASIKPAILGALIALRNESFLLEKRGELMSLRGLSAVGNLSLDIAKRQKSSALEILKSHGLKANIEILSAPCIGQGTFFFLTAGFENSIAGFSSLGQRGKKAEDVGKEAAEEFIEFLSSNTSIEKRLADQIVPYMALAGRISSQERVATTLTTSEITKHLLTNIWVVKNFLDVKVKVLGKEGEEGKVIIYP